MGQGPGATVASVGLQVAGDMFKAKGQEQSDIYRAEREQQAAEYGYLAAKQTSGQLTERLNQTLGTIDTMRAAMHTDPTSPTSAAVRGQAETVGETERSIAVGNLMAAARQHEADANYLKWAGGEAMTAGYITAAADTAKAFAGTGTPPSSFSPFGSPGGGGGGSTIPGFGLP